MADIIPPGFGEATVPLQHNLLARAAAVVFGFENLTPGGDPDVTAEGIQDVFVGAFGPAIDDDVTIGPTVVRLGQDGGEALVGVAAQGVNGTANRTDAIAPNTAALLHKRTNRGGRRGRGRMYLPWCLSDNNVNEAGVLGTTQRDGLSAAGATFLADLISSNYPMVLLHSSGVTVPGSPDPVTSMSCDSIIGTQRRRLGR